MTESNKPKSEGGHYSVKAPSRGGARKNSGRPKGAATKKTREIADKAAAEGITPLEYMLKVMRADIPAGLEPREALAAENMRFEAAKAAAPYIHPRLAAVEHTGKDGNALIPPSLVVTIEK